MSAYDYSATTALITGASRGIGEALARDLGRRGASLVLIARSGQRLDALAEELRADGGQRVETIPADLLRPGSAQEIADELTDRQLPVDLLINNAGMATLGPFLDRPLAPNLRSVELNITALMALTYHVGRTMIGRRAGGIVNIASGAAFQPMAYMASYGASKAFVLSFSEALGEELRTSGVRVMSAHPGPVATGFFDGTAAEIDSHAVQPDRIAKRILDDFARGRVISFPGRPSDRFATLVSRVLPRATVARIAGNINRKNGYAQG